MSQSERVFLSAEWRNLVMLNYDRERLHRILGFTMLACES
jgi:hypothetical protein